jgi:hypothetical protein
MARLTLDISMSLVVLLGKGVRLFEDNLADMPELECNRVIESPTGVTHLRYRVVKQNSQA